MPKETSEIQGNLIQTNYKLQPNEELRLIIGKVSIRISIVTSTPGRPTTHRRKPPRAK